MAISETKMQMVIANYFKDECDVNTSIRQAFEKGFRIGVKKGAITNRPQGEWVDDDFVGQYRCSECDYYAIDEYDFCPNCGADMRNSSEKPNNSTISKMEQVDKDINVRSKDELMTKGIWNAGYKTGYDKGYKDAQKVKDSQDLVKELVKTFCEDGTWLERQGVYTLTLAEAKQGAVDIIESVLAKDEPTTQTETQNSNLTFKTLECGRKLKTQLTAKCLECNNSKACKEKHWEDCRYEPLGYEVTAVVGTIKYEPQTKRSSE